jgi:voltage-gated potassium channel
MIDRRLFFIPIIFVVILSIGTAGYLIFQPEYGFLDALYMTVITITTIGYSEIIPLSGSGRIFNLFLIGIAVVGIFMIARMAGQMIIEGEILKVFGRRKMDKQLSTISNHHIVCGYGRVGRVICDELTRHGEPFVVIERTAKIVDEIRELGLIHVEGDCTQDGVLLAAGVNRARSLMNAIPDEAEAVYTTLSARLFKPDIFIMGRADTIKAEQMLRRAGANRVISPQVAAGIRMAMAVLRPSVIDFIAIDSAIEDGGARVEEVEVLPGSILAGKSLREADFRVRYGLNIIGVKKPDGSIIYNPTADYTLRVGDTLILFGSNAQLSKADKLFVGQIPGKTFQAKT